MDKVMPAQVQTATSDPVESTRAAIRVEVARVNALPAEERAKIGDKYTDPEKLWSALEAGDESRTPIIALTGFAGSEERARCLENMDDYMTKPLSMHMAAHKLRALVRQRTSQQVEGCWKKNTGASAWAAAPNTHRKPMRISSLPSAGASWAI